MEMTPDLLNRLNDFTRRKHTAEELYIFEVRLCDNEVDRDRERFSLSALSELEALFVGKTGVFDHNPSGEKQTARIFHTFLKTDDSRKTAADESYTALHAYAYMVRTEKNADLIREIDAGIKKEVSVSCAVGSHVCSICGKDVHLSPCIHSKGETYGGKRCHVILSQVTDAYEWSFVAVPAQRNAGVTKQYGTAADSEELLRMQEQLSRQSDLLQKAAADVRTEISQLACCLHGTSAKAVLSAAKRLDLTELMALRDELRQEQNGCCTSQFDAAAAIAAEEFQMP